DRNSIMIGPKTILIDGKWSGAADERTLPVIDPSTGAEFDRLARGGAAEIGAAVRAARRAFDEGPWGRMPAVERGRILTRIGRAIEADFETLWRLEAADAGKPAR